MLKGVVLLLFALGFILGVFILSWSFENSLSGKITLEFETCEGCELENKCYDVGEVVGARYCSNGTGFQFLLDQKKLCSEDYQCKSETCNLGRCDNVSSWNRFKLWLKSFLCELKVTC